MVEGSDWRANCWKRGGARSCGSLPGRDQQRGHARIERDLDLEDSRLEI